MTNGSAVLIASGAVCDMAGNCNPGINVGSFQIDSVPPSITCITPEPVFVVREPGASVSAKVTDAT
jgi:hypothetical protein